MKPSSWTKVKEPEAAKEYLAQLTYLPLKTYLKVPAVILFAGKIDKQLRKTEGLIGFSFEAEIMKKRFWTLSVWENKEALNNFVKENPHLESMKKLRPFMLNSNFTEWTIKADEIPPKWQTAKSIAFPHLYKKKHLRML